MCSVKTIISNMSICLPEMQNKKGMRSILGDKCLAEKRSVRIEGVGGEESSTETQIRCLPKEEE
jgi:hypothetical protein